jgi:hypothetical protein
MKGISDIMFSAIWLFAKVIYTVSFAFFRFSTPFLCQQLLVQELCDLSGQSLLTHSKEVENIIYIFSWNPVCLLY